MSPILDLQRRLMEIGRVRLGDEKTDPKKPGKPLSTFRFTSASVSLLEQIAQRYGGSVVEWKGAPDEGYFQVVTDAKEIEIILPPSFSAGDGRAERYSQFYELWSGGGCQRRCDGEVEVISGSPCICKAAGQEGPDRTCKITTRVSFMLPGSRVGVWRLETHGYWAAVESSAMLDFLRDAGATDFVPAVLRIEARTRKVMVNGSPQTRKFKVVAIDFPQIAVPELGKGQTMSVAINGPSPAGPKPALPPGEEPPEEPEFRGEPPMGTPPEIPQQADQGGPVPGDGEDAAGAEEDDDPDDGPSSVPSPNPVLEAAGAVRFQSKRYAGKSIADVHAEGNVAYLIWARDHAVAEPLKSALITYVAAHGLEDE